MLFNNALHIVLHLEDSINFFLCCSINPQLSMTLPLFLNYAINQGSHRGYSLDLPAYSIGPSLAFLKHALHVHMYSGILKDCCSRFENYQKEWCSLDWRCALTVSLIRHEICSVCQLSCLQSPQAQCFSLGLPWRVLPPTSTWAYLFR